MGKWTLENIIDRGVTDHDTPDLYGHEVRLCFRMRYRPALIGRFSEPPPLVWHEKIVMNERHNGTWWEFETNMYEHNPLSRTLLVWSRRYIEAYDAASVAGGAASTSRTRGSSRLFDQFGTPVTAADLRAGGTAEEQARAIRAYLKRHGDVLEIEISDIPSITRPSRTSTPGAHKERLLLFTVGVRGGDVWRMASQYLSVDGTVGEALWHRDFAVEALQRGIGMPSWAPLAGAPGPRRTPLWVTNWSSAGLTRVDPPAGVATPRVPVFAPGEYA